MRPKNSQDLNPKHDKYSAFHLRTSDQTQQLEYVSSCEDNTLGYATLREQQVLPFPHSPCIHIVYTLALKYIYIYICICLYIYIYTYKEHL